MKNEQAVEETLAGFREALREKARIAAREDADQPRGLGAQKTDLVALPFIATESRSRGIAHRSRGGPEPQSTRPRVVDAFPRRAGAKVAQTSWTGGTKHGR
jgi:hypothetical protein